MTLPDVDILVNAFRADAVHHQRCRRWLEASVNGDARFGISPHVLSGVVRIATYPRVFAEPSSTRGTLRFCDAILDAPQCVVIEPGPHHWSLLTRLCVECGARGNLVPDAWFAALAIEAACEWITLDRDYARFEGLRWAAPEP